MKMKDFMRLIKLQKQRREACKVAREAELALEMDPHNKRKLSAFKEADNHYVAVGKKYKRLELKLIPCTHKIDLSSTAEIISSACGESSGVAA